MLASARRTVCAIDHLQVDVLESLDELRAVKEAWERVYEQDPEAQYFLTWNWIYNWLDSTRQRCLILAVRSENADSYVAFFPLRLTSELEIDRGFRYSLRMAGSYYAGYTGFICDPAAEASAIAALVQALQKLNWAELHLDDIFPSERRLQLLFDAFPKSDFEVAQKPRPPHLTEGQVIDHDVYVIVPLESDWETFLQNRMGSHTRYNARNALKRIEAADGEFRISIADNESIEQDLEGLLRLWEARWGPKNPRYARYIVQSTKKMIPRCFEDGSIFIPVLWKGDERVAVTLNFADRRKGRLIQFLAGRDQSVKRPPPGFALNLFTLRWAIANGFTAYDFGTGNFSYKYDFGGQETLVKRFRIDVRSGANLGAQVDSDTLALALEDVEAAYKARQLVAAERGCREVLAFDREQTRMKDVLANSARLKTAAVAVLAEALKLLESGQTDDALWLFHKVIEIDSTNFEAHHQMGLIHFRQRSFKLAEQSLRKAVELNEKSAGAFNNLGSALAGLGRLTEALDCYSRAISLRPDYATALQNHANTKAAIERQQQEAELAARDKVEPAAPDKAELAAPDKAEL